MVLRDKVDSGEDWERLDAALVRVGLARSRAQASELIKAGHVAVRENKTPQVMRKPSQKVRANLSQTDFEMGPSDICNYVSRGGRKLAGALERTGLKVSGWIVLDIGQSTGGFTDCVLQHGAAQVLGIDVGQGQLDPQLASDNRVKALEKVHVDNFTPVDLQAAVGAPSVDLVVIDVSFISLQRALPVAKACLQMNGHILALVKPQFEVEAKDLNRQGIIKDPSRYPEVQQRIIDFARARGLTSLDYFPSSIPGGDGNQEFWCHFVLTNPQSKSDE